MFTQHQNWYKKQYTRQTTRTGKITNKTANKPKITTLRVNIDLLWSFFCQPFLWSIYTLTMDSTTSDWVCGAFEKLPNIRVDPLFFCSSNSPPTNVESPTPTDDHVANPQCMIARQRGFEMCLIIPPASRRQHLPPNTPPDVLDGYCSRCGPGRPSSCRLSAAATTNMEL